MKTAKDRNVNREVALLRDLKNAEIDTSDLPEVTDWGTARRGVFYAREGIKILNRNIRLSSEQKEGIAQPIDFKNAFPGVRADRVAGRSGSEVDSRVEKKQQPTQVKEQPDVTLWKLRESPTAGVRAGRDRGRWRALLQRLGLRKKVPDAQEHESE